MSLITASNTIQTNKMILGSSYGVAGQVLSSGGPDGDLTWVDAGGIGASINVNNIDTISGTTTLTLGGTNATSIALNDNVTASGTLGVTGITTASGGLQVANINSLTNNGVINIGRVRNETGVIIGKDTPAYSITLTSNSVYPTKIQAIDPISAIGNLTIGASQTATQPINIGGPTTGTVTSINSETTLIGGTLELTDIYSLGDVSMYADNSISIGTADYTGVGSAIAIGREGSIDAVVPRSTTTLRGLLDLSNGTGSAGQVLTSGGSTGSLTWATASGGVSFANGSITTITNSALTSYTFPTPILKTASPNAPIILLTGENGGTSLIVQLSVGTVSSNATQWTGFSYITSGAGLNKINWIAINQ